MSGVKVPWRPQPCDWSEESKEKLREDIQNYRPIGVPEVNILIAGPVGAGKSSLYNTINSVFYGHVTGHAVSGCSPHSLTTKYRKYPVRLGRGGKTLAFRLCDTMGLEENYGVEPEDFKPIMDGNLLDGYVFSNKGGINSDDPKFKAAPNLSDKVHVAVMVLDGMVISVLSQDVCRKLEKLKMHLDRRGIPTIVVMTKIDTICPDVENDLAKVYDSEEIAEKVEEIAKKIGIPRSQIMVMKNYESETELDDKLDILTLVTIRQVLRLADNFLDDQLDCSDT